MQRLDFARISQVQSVPNSCEASFCFEGQKEERVGAGARSAEEARGLYAKRKAELAEYKEALKDTSTAQKVMTVATAHSSKNF